MAKDPPANASRGKRHGFDPWVGKIPWNRKWPPLQYSCLESLIDRGACWAQSEVAESDTNEHTCIPVFSHFLSENWRVLLDMMLHRFCGLKIVGIFDLLPRIT